MKKTSAALLLFACLPMVSGATGLGSTKTYGHTRSVHVKPYQKKNGKVVDAYSRSMPKLHWWSRKPKS